jgi:hypothetical protein
MVYVVFSYMFRSQLGDHLQGVYVAVTITGSVGVGWLWSAIFFNCKKMHGITTIKCSSN